MARILVIDDNPLIRFSVRLALEAAGHQVLEAADGVEGTETFRQQMPDLVLCDLIMPQKDGLETIRELRSEFPEAKIIAISGDERRWTIDFLPVANELGAAEVLYKPLNAKGLVLAVEDVLATK